MEPKITAPIRTRLSELLAALSLVTDLGMANPPGESARACLLATGLARAMHLDEREVSEIYYTTLLKYLGCTAYAHEEARLAGGDDVRFRAGGALVDFADSPAALTFLFREAGRGRNPLERGALMIGALVLGKRGSIELAASHCEVAAATARRIGLGTGVQRALAEVMERWDGKGEPRGLAGEEIALAARFALLASRAVIFHRLGGAVSAVAAIRNWSGRLLDPRLVEAFGRHGERLLREADELDAARAVMEAEPGPQIMIDEHELDRIAEAFADLVDLKVTFLRGHSPAVAALAAGTAHRLGYPDDQVSRVRRAALLRDLGRSGIANGIWEKSSALDTAEWEQVRLHAYHSERILSRSAMLAPLAPIAGMHHERLDSSGYHRGSGGESLPVTARLVAAADVYCSLCAERPYRPALAVDHAAATLVSEVRNGRLDGDVVQALLASEPVGADVESSSATGKALPAGLTEREAQVLRLIARGASAKQVARELDITPKTAGHHVQHIYRKIGVSTRAAAALFAMEQGLLRGE